MSNSKSETEGHNNNGELKHRICPSVQRHRCLQDNGESIRVRICVEVKKEMGEVTSRISVYSSDIIRRKILNRCHFSMASFECENRQMHCFANSFKSMHGHYQLEQEITAQAEGDNENSLASSHVQNLSAGLIRDSENGFRYRDPITVSYQPAFGTLEAEQTNQDSRHESREKSIV